MCADVLKTRMMTAAATEAVSLGPLLVGHQQYLPCAWQDTL